MIELGKITDLEIALKLTTHIQHPCSTSIDGKIYTLRDFYLRLARETLSELRDNYAHDFLESIIRVYED
jgi:hypothetical protein